MANEEKKIWGIHTQDDNLFLKGNVIAIGWHEMGDLSQIDANRDAFKEKYLSGGDAIVAYDPDNSNYG